MSGGLKVSGTLILRVIGVVLVVFFHQLLFGVLLFALSRRLSNALDLDEKLGRMISTAKSRPRRSRGARKQKPKSKTKAPSQEERLVPCPYCRRDIKPNTRKCPICNHTL